ncbi:MAG TPA: enoyl-CoA hydratase-related protein [Dehalococcoidia bacterium]|nr:enoyl-CoA hydratase-related protein [Dehalococcoidia bacterium]
MSFEFIQSETRDGVLILTMNDPATRNAIGSQMSDELEQELSRFETESALRVLVMTGVDPAFCSGANVRGMQRNIQDQQETAEVQPSPWEALDPSRYGQIVTRPSGPPIVLRLHHIQKPTIAAVNGAAYGLGCGIALTCDIRIASEKARFSEAFVRNGLIPADGSCWQLPRLIGVANTLLLQYTGDAVDGQEALRLGMCSRVVPHEQLLDTALELGARLANGPTYQMSLIKRLVEKGLQQTLEEHLVDASRAQSLARRTEDHREGVQAFLEKRLPNFKGR